MQVYGSRRPQAIHDLQLLLSACIDDVHNWMQSNHLQFNTNKMELLRCATARCQHQLLRSACGIGTDDIILSLTVQDLGIYIDADLGLRSHVQWIVAGCFVVLYQLCSIRRPVPLSVFQTLAVALMLSRLDYGNTTLCLLYTSPSPRD